MCTWCCLKIPERNDEAHLKFMESPGLSGLISSVEASQPRYAEPHESTAESSSSVNCGNNKRIFTLWHPHGRWVRGVECWVVEITERDGIEMEIIVAYRTNEQTTLLLSLVNCRLVIVVSSLLELMMMTQLPVECDCELDSDEINLFRILLARLCAAGHVLLSYIIILWLSWVAGQSILILPTNFLAIWLHCYVRWKRFWKEFVVRSPVALQMITSECEEIRSEQERKKTFADACVALSNEMWTNDHEKFRLFCKVQHTRRSWGEIWMLHVASRTFGAQLTSQNKSQGIRAS